MSKCLNVQLAMGSMLKTGTIHSITAKITGEKRGAPEGVWVQGGERRVKSELRKKQ